MIPTYLARWWSSLLLENLRFGDRHVGPVQRVRTDMPFDQAQDRPFVLVYALDERGQRRAEIPVQEAPGGVTFTLGGKHRTLWYELVTGTKVYLPFVGCDCLVGGE